MEDGTKQTEFLLQKQKTITLDAREGSCDISSIKTDFAGKVTELPTPVNDGYEFKGWETSEGKLISVGDTLISDITLYADWGDGTTGEGDRTTEDGDGAIDESDDATVATPKGGNLVWLYVMVAVVVLGSSAVAVVFIFKKKKTQ